MKSLFTYHFPRTCPYSLTKINWTLPSWGPSKLNMLKSMFCGHQITFHVNSTFSKILHIIPPSFPTIFAGCERCQCFVSHLYPSLTVPNLLPNVDECENFEIRANSCWGKDESCTFFIWAQFFLDNSKIKIRHVRSQVNKVQLLWVRWACEVNSNFSRMIRIKKIITR